MLDPYYRTLLLALLATCDLDEIHYYMQEVGWIPEAITKEKIEAALEQMKKLVDLEAHLDIIS